MERKACCTAAAVVALATAGCGSSGPLSRADLAKKGDAICKQDTATVRAMVRRAGTLPAGIRKALPTMTRDIDRLAALKPPAELRAQYTRFIALERARIARIRQALGGKPGPAPSVATAHAEDRVRRELGLPNCS